MHGPSPARVRRFRRVVVMRAMLPDRIRCVRETWRYRDAHRLIDSHCPTFLISILSLVGLLGLLGSCATTLRRLTGGACVDVSREAETDTRFVVAVRHHNVHVYS